MTARALTDADVGAFVPPSAPPGSREAFARLARRLGYVYAHPETAAQIREAFTRHGVEVRENQWMERGMVVAIAPPKPEPLPGEHRRR